MSAKSKKTAVITGGTEGIGAAIAKEFAQNGYHVVVGARQDNGFTKKLGDQGRYCKMDVKFEEGHQLLAEEAIAWTKRLDVYINCAGFSEWRPIKEVDEQFFADMISVNLKGTLWGCKTAAQFLSKKGSIINVASIAGKRGSVNNSVYCSSKFGVIGMTQALARELGPKGIRVNAVCPVYVQTPGLLKALAEAVSPTKGKDVQNYLKEFTKKDCALGQLPTAQQVAQACLFLASDAAGSITGQSMNVDGGIVFH